VEARHKETEAFVGCIVGLIVFLMGFVIRLPSGSPIAGFINFLLIISGIFIMIITAVSSQYYSNKRKNLLKVL
jgi:divalent metal cation (Fe/Co/Zn/Cd) transporter